jgi:hypothetical protein
LDSAVQNHFSCVKIPQKFGCTVKNNQKLSLFIFRFRVNILKNEKSGIPKSPNGSFAESLNKIW